ncbi:Uncharacterised protein [Vibrio cholerae]|uniref:Uncharacterized protein n=1 Tax=Vibrio cholerae TaxID=666 RepID=A0A655T8Y3_VIBCL|nr:Uncharacterised protein [Vibrio cholerae]CSB32328.1 Uncharacterised protein [Vibrio cholerae]CSC28702.1 Uncharacterised protein [Vibrio cholerae]CSC51903.1 Uncharacterised protein [Vibrio cholerae]CSC70443.1 Uncharacterised protein [Vibrio cholerae]
MDVFKLSLPPMLKLWHELHEINPDLDKRGSKYSFLPNSAFPMWISCAGKMGETGSFLGDAAKAYPARERDIAKLSEVRTTFIMASLFYVIGFIVALRC